VNSEHFILLAQMGTDGRKPALQVMERGWRAKLSFLSARIRSLPAAA